MCSSAVETKARTRVLDDPYLLEMILLRSSIQDLLVNFSRVCTAWNRHIAGSTTLQQKQFLRADTREVIYKSKGCPHSLCTTARICPWCLSQMPLDTDGEWYTHNAYRVHPLLLPENNTYASICFNRPNIHGEEEESYRSLRRILYRHPGKEHSWRRTLLTQPPLRKVHLSGILGESMWLDDDVSYAQGATWASVFKTIEKRARERKVENFEDSHFRIRAGGNRLLVNTGPNDQRPQRSDSSGRLCYYEEGIGRG